MFLVGSFCSFFLGVFFVFWGLGFVGFCRLALVVPVYLEAPYAFINKVFLLIKKNKNNGIAKYL
jgi:hypothetical protein